MKIDEGTEPSSSSGAPVADMPKASADLLQAIMKTETDEDFVDAINKGREVHAIMGKTELYKWTAVLNRCDAILEKGTKKVSLSVSDQL